MVFSYVFLVKKSFQVFIFERSDSSGEFLAGDVWCVKRFIAKRRGLFTELIRYVNFTRKGGKPT
jgi:hypothetical protein